MTIKPPICKYNSSRKKEGKKEVGKLEARKEARKEEGEEKKESFQYERETKPTSLRKETRNKRQCRKEKIIKKKEEEEPQTISSWS